MFTKSRFRVSTHFGTETSVLTPVLPVLRSLYRLSSSWGASFDREPAGDRFRRGGDSGCGDSDGPLPVPKPDV
jgi:hypothetical protein